MNLRMEIMKSNIKAVGRELASKMAREVVEVAFPLLMKGDAMALRCEPGNLLRILARHAGDGGPSEKAEETLKRIVQERDRFREGKVRKFYAEEPNHGH